MRAVIFDLGKVLVHYEHSNMITAVVALGKSDAATIEQLFGEVGSALGVGKLDTRELYQFYRQRTGQATDFDSFVTAVCAGLTRNDEALAYALTLQNRPGVTVGIISNTIEAHASWLDEHVPELAEFDLVMMSNEVGIAKPDTEIFRLALELLDIPANQAIYVDDLAVNVQGAEAVGMAGIVHRDWAITRPALEDWLATEFDQ